MKFNFEKNIFNTKKENRKDNNTPEKQEENLIDFFSESYKEEVLPIIEIIKPDDMSLEEYQEQVKEDLLETIKQNQLARKKIVSSPEEMTKEAKEALMSKLKAVLEDNRNYELKKKPDPELVKKAKIALLYEDDLSDFEKYFSKNKNLKNLNIRDLKNYIVGYEKEFKFTESDINSLLKTKFSKSLSSSQNDFVNYLSDDYGSMRSLPESLASALIQSQEGKGGVSYLNYILESGFKVAENKKYSNTYLEQLLARDNVDLCFKFADKFEDGALDKILKSGISNYQDPIEYLKEFNLSEDDFAKYLDLAVKHSIGYKIRENFGKYYDKNREARSCYENLIENKLHPVEMDINKKNDLQNFSTIKEVISDGYIGLAMATHFCYEYMERYAKEDYENFKKDIEKYDQEHLVIEYLKDEDKVKYAQKLIDQGEEYQIVKLAEKFREHSLENDIFEKINKKDLAPMLKGKISIFKNLKEKDVLDFVDRGRVDVFVDNIESFSFSPEFLLNEKVQEASFLEFNNNIFSVYPNEGRIFYDKIPLPKEKTQAVLLEAVNYKLEEGRIDWACDLIKNFPEVKSLLQEEKFYQQALNGLNKANYIEYLVNILESFPLPKENLNDNNLISKIVDDIYKRSYNVSGEKNEKEIFASIRRDYNQILRINNFIKLPQHLIDFNKVIDKVENISFTTGVDIRIDLIKILYKTEDPIENLEKSLKLLDEINTIKGFELDKNLTLIYISRFLNDDNKSEKERFLQNIKSDIESLANNKSFDFKDNNDYYQYVLKQVYPERNYNTYYNLDQYQDLSHHLDKYKFNKDGYDVKLSGVTGYRIKDGFEANQKLLDDFSTRVRGIKNLARSENLINFLDKSLVDSKAKTLEGKILDYFKQNNYSVDTMDVLLAYQLLGSYDDFANASSDRLSSEADKTSRDFVLLDEIANQYGDNMKETIKVIHSKVVKSLDKDLFLSDNKDREEKKYQEAFLIVSKDLSKIPREKLNNDAIKKKIGKTIKNIFQGFPSIQKKSDYFASLFSVNDFDNLEEVWKKHVDEFFMLDEESNIDSAKIESLQVSVFNTIQNEINKYEEIKEVDTERGDVKLKKERVIKGYFSKNKENAHARMVADVCIANDPNMLKNENYFEFVLFDQEKNKCAGTVMLLEMDEPEDGKKYLLYGPNPSVSLVSEVSAKKLYTLLTKNIATFAKDNNFDAVLVNKTHGRSTNRAGLFQQSLEQSCQKNKDGQEIVFNLKKSHLLGGNYSYKDNLRAVWIKE